MPRLRSLVPLVATLAGPAAGAAVAAERPNVVLVMADDQGWGDVGYNGHPVLETPNLDAAAAAGLRFDRFYAAAPVCSPTRGSVMTGRHPNRYGVFQWGYPLRPQETTVAEALSSAGYATGHFGKWHLGSVRRRSGAHPGIHGFEEWLSAPNFFDNDPILSHRGRALRTEGESSVVTAEAALEWIREQAGGERPFLAVVWFGSPHAPHTAAEEDRALYAGEPEAMRDFLGEITGIDRAFGLLRDGLEELGLREDTLLWYTSDNGALPERGSTGGRRGAKGEVYDGGLMVPAFLEWPRRVRQARATDYRALTSDILPTLLEVAGAAPEPGLPLDGVSLVPAIEDRVSVRSEPMGFWHRDAPGIRTPSAELMAELLAAQEAGEDLEAGAASRRPDRLPDPPYPLDRFPGHAAWIDGDWKLHRIERGEGGIRWELYDLASDPAESRDLLAESPQRFRSMRGPFLDWLESVVRSLNGEDYGGVPRSSSSASAGRRATLMPRRGPSQATRREGLDRRPLARPVIVGGRNAPERRRRSPIRGVSTGLDSSGTAFDRGRPKVSCMVLCVTCATIFSAACAGRGGEAGSPRHSSPSVAAPAA